MCVSSVFYFYLCHNTYDNNIHFIFNRQNNRKKNTVFMCTMSKCVKWFNRYILYFRYTIFDIGSRYLFIMYYIIVITKMIFSL